MEKKDDDKEFENEREIYDWMVRIKEELEVNKEYKNEVGKRIGE
jgi:hypothetical protein